MMESRKACRICCAFFRAFASSADSKDPGTRRRPAEHVVGLACLSAQDACHRAQHSVTGLVAPGVVDALEVIDVDVEQRQRQAVAPVLVQFVGFDLFEKRRL